MGIDRTLGCVASCLAAAILAAGGFAAPVLAQGSGRIIGTVSDADTNEGIANVQVSVEGSGLGAVTGQRGTFTIANVPAGRQTLVFNILGYDAEHETVTVDHGQTTTADVALVEGFLEMGAITVIGASRSPSRIVDAPAAVAVVSGEELQRKAAHGQLPKLFADKPGIDVVQSGIQDFNINARGYNSSLNRRVLVLQDGIDRSLGFLQAQEWTALSMPLDDLGRLDFIRGPGSALYGANAFSGVLNITTPSPGDIIGTKVALAGGQRESGRFDIRHAGVTVNGRWGYKGNVGYSSVGNTFSESRTRVDAVGACPAPQQACAFEYGPLPVEAAPIDEDAVTSLYGSARVDRNFSDGSVWTLEGGMTHTENEIFVTGIGRVQVNGADRPWARTQYGADRWTAMAWYSGRRSDDAGEDGDNQTSLQSGAELREKSDIYHAEIQTNWASNDGRFLLVGGASNRWYAVDTDGSLMEEKHDDTITSLFGQAEYQFHPLWNTLFALRYDRFTVNDAEEIAPKAALVFSPSPDHSLRFTFNRAYQVPNYSELFLSVAAGPVVPLDQVELGLEAQIAQQTGQQIDLPLNFGPTPIRARGNDDLQVEELAGFEVGYKGVLVDGRLFATVDVYSNEIDDFVTDLLPRVNADFRPFELPLAFQSPQLAPFGPLVIAALQSNPQLQAIFPLLSILPDGSLEYVVSYANAGEVSEQGVEMGLTFLLAPSWELSANYTYFDFEIQDTRTDPPGNEVPEEELLPNTPKHKGNLGIVYNEPERFHAGIDLHVQEAFDWAAGVFAGRVPGYATVSLTGGWQVTDNARLNLVWTNVLNKEHFQLYGGSVLGSRAIGGLTFTF
ncbi:MAG TPA: TonB-dependent receptor [Gemmatimonadota bacterium]|nr:TonB-dependent receptor [Gemmatimonadota bacterium]